MESNMEALRTHSIVEEMQITIDNLKAENAQYWIENSSLGQQNVILTAEIAVLRDRIDTLRMEKRQWN